MKIVLKAKRCLIGSIDNCYEFEDEELKIELEENHNDKSVILRWGTDDLSDGYLISKIELGKALHFLAAYLSPP